MSDTQDHSARAPGHEQGPKVRLGGTWLPAHDVWRKIETVAAVVDVIEHFNAEFAHLATAETLDVVPCVRRRLDDIEQRMPNTDGQGALAKYAARLLATLPPEQVIETLATHKGVQMDHAFLAQLAGENHYDEALQRDARVLESHKVSAEQTARLWDDLGRPAPNGRSWRATDVEDLRAAPVYETI